MALIFGSNPSYDKEKQPAQKETISPLTFHMTIRDRVIKHYRNRAINHCRDRVTKQLQK